ncbi:FIGNL1-interacting regulator of recombination and mitosis-like [Physella acuta]|uniref:FIGNL1-interacting regulator of recombination and mitosis-like n=1 Tax=Physella acuta TaxID=109671 RepID=UPI0027DDA523|nr:FIGNL1-interacting regulator of recombination and mitosis-like [Physella acuta]XP_059151453.1 FIGNL1-interacting regulator of recombination and mitosis-like [Physella acuta]XP_059151454.1 FIGNL1-interacting regulator of recombination and mitosis-like [Physella acuta]
MSQSTDSQLDFLEEVIRWDQDKCQQNLDRLLPALVSHLKEQSESEFYKNTGLLKLLCYSVLPCVPLEDMEDKIFSNLKSFICSLMDSALQTIAQTVTNKATDLRVGDTVVECLQCLVELTQCVDACVKYAVRVSKSIAMSYVQSLPECAVQVLKQTYTHCKNSNELYGDMMTLLAGQLSTLFKEAHTLQMSLLNLLDKMVITGPLLEDHVQILCSVCTGLYEVCTIVTSLDVKLVISLWKGISRICSQHLTLLRDRLDVSPLINFLCEEIHQGYLYLFQICPDSGMLTDEKDLSKLVKILGFQMKVLVALLRDFADYLDGCETSVVNLLLLFHRCLPPSPSSQKMPEKHESEIRTHLVTATSPILRYLIENRALRQALTQDNTDKRDEDSLPRLLLQLMVLNMLPQCKDDVLTTWLCPVNYRENIQTRGIISAIFQSVKLCEVEMRCPLKLPGVVVPGNAQRQVGLYEYVVTHICGYIGACLPSHIGTLEAVLEENLFEGTPLTAVLAADCWCFLVRFGSADFCNDHIQKLISVYQKVKNSQVLFRLENLLQRLIKFMSHRHQAELVDCVAPSNNPGLWLALTPDCLNAELANQVRQELAVWAVAVAQSESCKAAQLTLSLKILTYLFSTPPSCLSAANEAAVLGLVCKLWAEINSITGSKRKFRFHLLTELLYLTRSLLPYLGTHQILQILSKVQEHITPKDPAELLVSLSHFLSEFGHLPPASFKQIEQSLPELYHPLLVHPHPLVHHCALESLTQLVSQDTDLVPAYLPGGGALAAQFENFINKVPHQSTQEFVLVNYLKQQVEPKAQVDGPESISFQLSEDLGERPTKKCKFDETSGGGPGPAGEDCDYNSLLARLTTLAHEVEQTCGRSQPPDWFMQAAQVAMARLNDCLAPNRTWFDSLS